MVPRLVPQMNTVPRGNVDSLSVEGALPQFPCDSHTVASGGDCAGIWTKKLTGRRWLSLVRYTMAMKCAFGGSEPTARAESNVPSGIVAIASLPLELML